MFRSLSPAILFASSCLAQHICFAEGTSTALTIATVAESNPTGPGTVVLQNAELLPVEITGRTLAREGDLSRSRRTVRNGVERVELPSGGRLFRYRRDGGQHWGFLQVAADGATRVVLEQPGAGLADPFADRIGVADDGLHAVVPLAAGGAFAVNLDGTLYASTGRYDRLAVPPTHAVAPASSMVGTTDFFYVTLGGAGDRVFRCALADGATPVDLTPPSTALDRMKDELAMSGDGQHVVFLHGQPNLMRLWHATMSGPATVLPPGPSKYEEPNYLPTGPGEPAMLLNHDGSRLFFVDALIRDELWLLDLQGALPAMHFTDDPIFQPYIGVHILPKFNGNQLLIAIGDAGQMDWFRAELDSAGGTVDNLTGTGSLLQPYPSGTLAPIGGVDAGASLLVVEQTALGQDLRRLDVATGTSAIVQSDAALTVLSGSSFTGVGDTVVRGAGGDVLYRGATASPFASTPFGMEMGAPVHGPILSATLVNVLGVWDIPAYYYPGGTVIAGNLEVGLQQVVMTQLGGIVLNGQTVRYHAIGTSATLQRPAALVRLVLSGAGG